MLKQYWVIGICAAALTLMPAAPAWAESQIPEGVYADEISLGGMTKEEAEQAITEYVKILSDQKITLDMGEDKADTTAGELGLFWSNQEAVGQALAEYQGGNLIKRYVTQVDLKAEPDHIGIEVSVEEGKVKDFIESKSAGLMEEPVDAAIDVVDGEFVVTPSVTGRMIDTEATNAALNEAFQKGLDGAIEVQARITEKQPKITTEDLEGIQDVLGTFSTDFSSSGYARATNVQVGASKIDNHVLMPGETLSGYECLQPLTVENGYKNAASYENGRVVDSIGGGVCQLATTLYNAALEAELEITQRQNHSMIVTYVKPSMDAAIAGTVKDIKITNNYSTPIYVEGKTEGRTLTFTIYGKETRPANREVKYVSETLRRTDPGAPKEIPDPSLKPGARVKEQSAHYGLESRLWKYVYVDGKEVEKTLLNEDVYYASKAVYRVGPAAVSAPVPPIGQPVVPETPAPSEPAPTNPEPTQPQETHPDAYGPGIGLETQPAAPAETPAPAPLPAETPAPAPAPEVPAEGAAI
ncbi:MAG: VanW family protein [Lachnospiraceae bacterium]|jgi:vancomycin resistance protein YoaR